MEKHVAYNLETGEIIACANGNHLKRCVRIANATTRKWGYSTGKWIFGHKGIRAIIAKADCIRKGK